MSSTEKIPDFTSGLPRTSIFVGAVRQTSQHPARLFGWHWEITEDVDFLTTELHRRGRTVYVWETPQFKAVEWLIGQKRMPFPPVMDAGLHGTFCKILRIEALCRDTLLHGDISYAIGSLEKALQKLTSAADDLSEIHPSILEFLKQSAFSEFAPEELNIAHAQMSIGVGAALGTLQSQLKFQKKLHKDFSGKSGKVKDGRPSNWVAKYIARQAADIYRTAYKGPITYDANSSRPSFRVFLEKFSKSYPDAERADSRALDRYIRRGGYEGTPFAPVK